MILNKIGGVAMNKDVDTKFIVGDEVTIVSNGSHGKVSKIISVFGEGQNVYAVDVMGIIKICIESNLEMYRKKNTILNVNMDEISMSLMIEDRINEIIKNLNLKKSKEDKDQLINAAKLQTYLTTTDDYVEDTVSIGNSFLKYNLYHGLINGENDPLINSCIFTEVLRKLGMDVKNVVLKLQDSSFYVANLVLIGNFYYFFDLTLEKEIFRDNGKDIDNFILCCAALGKNSYTQFFKPLCLIDFNDCLGPNELPKNISSDDIDIDLLNKLLNMESN
jgi:hypothetical protein